MEAPHFASRSIVLNMSLSVTTTRHFTIRWMPVSVAVMFTSCCNTMRRIIWIGIVTWCVGGSIEDAHLRVVGNSILCEASWSTAIQPSAVWQCWLARLAGTRRKQQTFTPCAPHTLRGDVFGLRFFTFLMLNYKEVLLANTGIGGPWNIWLPPAFLGTSSLVPSSTTRLLAKEEEVDIFRWLCPHNMMH